MIPRKYALPMQALKSLTGYDREKARIPAWTDRILRKGTNLRQINYNCAPLRFSDHRPVYATFQCTVSIIDEARREALSREIYDRRQLEVGTTTASAQNDDTDDEDLIGYDSIEAGLPPASSDKRKWWLDNGQPARSDIRPPQKGLIPNPNRPSNPYTPTDEPDWVTVPRMPTPRGQVTSSVPPPPPNPRNSNGNSTNGTRKLLPSFNTAKSAASTLTKNLSQASLQDTSAAAITTFKQPLTSERSLSTSTMSSTSKKAPPPVARKPVHLTSSRSSTASPTLSTVSTLSTSRAILPSQQKARPTTGDYTGFPPPPRSISGAGPPLGSIYGRREIEDRRDVSTPPPPPQPRGAAKKTDMNGNAGDGTDDEGPRPSLPPRRPIDLLGDSSAGAIGDWVALKPT